MTPVAVSARRAKRLLGSDSCAQHRRQRLRQRHNHHAPGRTVGRLGGADAPFGAAGLATGLATGLGAGLAAGLGASLGRDSSGLGAGLGGAGLGAAGLAAGADAGLAGATDFLPVSQSGAVRKGLPSDGEERCGGADDSGFRTGRFRVPPGSCTRATGAMRTLCTRAAGITPGKTP